VEFLILGSQNACFGAFCGSPESDFVASATYCRPGLLTILFKSIVHTPYQYIYFMKKVLAIPIPINELQKYAILSPTLSAILFLVKTV